jgi:hypothetical protein
MKPLLPLLLLALAALPAPAQDWKKKVDQDRVNAAVKKGTDFMLQMSAGGLGEFAHPEMQKVGKNIMLSHAELYYLTLYHGGVDPADINMRRLLKYMLSRPVKHTYTAALQAMVLQQVDPWRYQDRLGYIAQFLTDNQCENGQWHYGEPIAAQPPPVRQDVATTTKEGQADVEAKATKRDLQRIEIKKGGKGPETGDNSNSQYAALGIRACHDANIRFPKETIAAAKKWWESSQNKDGGWGYRKDEDSYASMTAGALGSLAIYNFVGGGQPNAGGAIAKGLTWMAGNFSVTENLKYQYPKAYYLYYMYALERAGVYLGVDYLGKRDWYAEGANRLLEDQKQNGTWGDNITVDTCYAILFLRRASRPLRPVATSVEKRPVIDDDK